MKALARALRHVRSALRRTRLDAELRDELAQHREWRAQTLVDRGVPEEEARRRAASAVGNVTRLREEARDVWGFPAIDAVVQDLRYGVRLLRRTPAFTAVAGLSLAIGIGASAAVFSLADAFLLRKLPVREPDALVILRWVSGPVFPFESLSGNSESSAESNSSTSFSRAAFEAMRHDARPLLDLFGFADLYRVSVAVDGVAELGGAHAVSGNYFGTLGIAPAAGRSIGTADDAAGAPPAAMIAYSMWLRRFGRSPGAIGRTIVVNGAPFTIAGVTPRGFRGTGQVGDAPDVFLPLALRDRVAHGGDPSNDPNFWWVLIMGRLRDGVTSTQAQGTLDLVLKRTVRSAKPEIASGDLPRVELVPGARGQVEERDGMRDSIRAMAIVVSIVLLVACANVATLLLARGQARARELSVRAAIGASRGRVLRQLLTEGLLLGACGSALGVVAARWISHALRPAVSQGPASGGLLDWRLLAFVAVLASASAILFALVPALRSTATPLTAGLQEAGRGTVGSRHRNRLAGSLVIVQIALSMVLVVTAALLVRSVRNLERVDLGFDPERLLIFRIDPTLNGADLTRVRAIYADVLARLRAAPGVRHATLTSHTLIARSASIGLAVRESETVPARASREFMRQRSVWRLAVDPAFFTTMRIPILRGRALEPRDVDGAQLVAVVNRRMARQLFESEEVVGRRFKLGSLRDAPAFEIVGVAADAAYTSVRDAKPPTVYLSYLQQPMKQAATFEVRTAGDPEAFAPIARDMVRQVDANLPPFGVRSQEEQIAESMREEKLFARLATLLGVVTVTLSAIGLYGLLAYSVSVRVPEIGIRLALGAGRGDVGWMILRQSLLLAGVGLVIGIGAAAAATRVVESLLYELPPRDPVAMAIAGGVLLLVSALAGYLPARRAARVDPLVALRTE